jgi:hypothetical protein
LAGPAVQPISTQTALQRVSPAAPIQGVVAPKSSDHVRPAVARDGVGAAFGAVDAVNVFDAAVGGQRQGKLTGADGLERGDADVQHDPRDAALDFEVSEVEQVRARDGAAGLVDAV